MTGRRLAPAFLTRAYPLPVEMLIIAAVIAVWQLLRIPFEGSTRISLAHAHDWLALERRLHVDIEPSVLRFVHGREWLYDGAKRFYANFDATFVIGFMAIARLLDPIRYPKLRIGVSSCCTSRRSPSSRSTRWPRRTGSRACRSRTAHRPIRARFATRLLRRSACTSATPSSSSPGLLWLRPRAPLAWIALLYPVVVFVVILGTGNHYVLDTLIGTACVLFGFAAAHLIHGPLPRATASATWLRIALAGTGFALIAFAINGGFIGEVV